MTSTKSAEAVSPLRRRMIEDMSVRKFGDKTRHDYIRHVESFAKFLGRSPDAATGEDLRRYQVHQTESGVHPPAMNGSVAALRFFFKTTLGRADLATRLARVHYPRRLPRVLSPEDVGRLLEAAPGPGLKYKAALSVAYGAGLRASEVVALTVADIDSKRMLIRVEQGKSLPPRRRGAARTGTPCSRHGCSKCFLFKASSETMLTIAADPKHLGARIGFTSVLHTWGSAMTHHPHVHMIVPGGGLSTDGSRWVAAKPRFFLPRHVLSDLFRALMLAKLLVAHAAGRLQFFGPHAHLANAKAFRAFLAPLRKKRWYLYAKRPFAGPKAVLAYLSRYTHRVAISNSRLIRANATSVTFRVKNYRAKGRERYTTMTLATGEFIRRFLIHVLPQGFHRIRHYGLFAGSAKAGCIATARQLLGMPVPSTSAEANSNAEAVDDTLDPPCPCCGGRMRIIEVFKRGQIPRHQPSPRPVAIRIDTS